MAILREVCSAPTAPGRESAVVAIIEQFVKSRRGLMLERDRFGNLMIGFRRHARTRRPRWVFQAHMDHPGFVALRMTGARVLEAEFRGMVFQEYFVGARVRFFDAGREITGRVTSVEPDPGRPNRPGKATIRVAGPVSPGSPGMFDLGEGRIAGERFHSRAIDDVAGTAALLVMLDELHRDPPRTPVAVLLTRAEEGGFVGAIAAVKHPQLLRGTDRIITIECSAMQPYAPQGAGPIIRVGDKTSIFNSAMTYFLTEQAQTLAKKDKTFRFQRALMPGGTCEAAVFDAFGYQAGAMCVAMGNYHNMDASRTKLAAEHINIRDWLAMVRLFVHIARNAHDFRPFASFKGSINRLWVQTRKWLQTPP